VSTLYLRNLPKRVLERLSALALMGKRMHRYDGVDVNTIKTKSWLQCVDNRIKYVDKSITVWEFVNGDYKLSVSKTPKTVFFTILIKELLWFHCPSCAQEA